MEELICALVIILILIRIISHILQYRWYKDIVDELTQNRKLSREQINSMHSDNSLHFDNVIEQTKRIIHKQKLDDDFISAVNFMGQALEKFTDSENIKKISGNRN